MNDIVLFTFYRSFIFVTIQFLFNISGNLSGNSIWNHAQILYYNIAIYFINIVFYLFF